MAMVLVGVSLGVSVAFAAPVTQQLQNDNGWRPAWGLDRIDQRGSVLDDRYTYSSDGTGVDVYVFDSGINSAHEDFGGRVVAGYTAINDGLGTEDCAGHGSHTASLIGGATYGVAKNVRLVPVRVLNCNNANPSSASLYPAIDWMIEHHQNGVPAVVNLSVGMPKSLAFNDAIRRLIDDGMIVVGAAGNQNRDACLYSPASEPSIISVGASDRSELRASYSNFGTCVDLFAPGSDLVGAWVGSTTTYRSSSGTSNAAPIVSGIVATMLQREPTLTQQQAEQRLVANATSGALFNIGVGSPNLLAFSGFVVAPDVPTSTTTPTTVPPTTAPPTTVAPPPSLAPTTTVSPRAIVSPPVPSDLQCQTPAARVRIYGVPYVCVNIGTALMWIPQRYSPGRP
jgi:subtilisin family serine protease